MNKTYYTCPVCGYEKLENKLYDNNGFGTSEICVCCGFEFGNDDFPEKENAYNRWRKNWVDGGCKWFSKYTKPDDGWSATKQLAKLTKKKSK